MSKKIILLLSSSLLFIFNLGLLITRHSFGWVQVVIGLPIILILPGLLTLLIMGLAKLDLRACLLTITTSLFELFAVGLCANYIPELFSSHAPLHTAAIVILFDCLIVSLITFAGLQKHVVLEMPRLLCNKWDVLIIGLSLLTILASVFGTFRLNNGGSNIVTMFSLLLGIIVIGLVMWLRNRINTVSMVVALFSVGLSVLLMTSLRSWYITGHDVKSEFRVFTLTNQLGKWSIANYRNAYNACISITILPVVFTKLLHTSGLVVFKFIFQLLFALCPIAIFILLRKYINSVLAFFGGILFISYPTFTTDSPMLTRQEIAFLFFATLLVVWFVHDESWLRKKWRHLFLIMSAGVILSHYSTTYMYVAILLLTYIMLKILRLFTKQVDEKEYGLQHSGLLVLIIVLGAFLWYSQATQASSNLTGVLENSLGNISNLLGQDNRNADVNYVFTGVGSNSTQLLTNYITTTKSTKSQNDGTIANSLVFLNSSLPASPLLNGISSLTHVSIPSIISKLYYSVGPKLYQIFIFLGLIFVILQIGRKKLKNLPIEYTALCIAGSVVLGLEIILPNISLDYGLMRALQQDLMFLVLPLIAVVYFLTEKIRKGFGLYVILAYVMFNFCIYTNVLPQLTGGVPAQLNLNNSGPYFGAYYAHKADLLAFSWADSRLPHNISIAASSFDSALSENPNLPFTRTIGILPFQISPNGYVLLQYEQATGHLTYIDVAGKLLPVKVDMLDYGPRDLVYSTGESMLLK